MRPGRSVASVFVFLLLAMGWSAWPAGAPEDDGFTLAVVRRDAIVIPFATYDGKRWKNSWPLPESRITAPISNADVPKRWWTGRDPIARWTFFPIRGESREISTQGPTWFPSHCSQAVGLRTSYQATEPTPPPNVQPYPKDGLAVSGAAKITPIEIFDVASSPAARELEKFLAEPVYDSETKIVHQYVRTSPGWTHSYTDEERKVNPVRLEALYRVTRGLGDRDVYYFEALKHYAVREESKESTDTRRLPSREDIVETARARQSAATDASVRSAPEPGSQPDPPVPFTPDRGALAKRSVPSGASKEDKKSPAAEELEKAGFAPCDLITYVSGWVTRRGDEKINPINVNVIVTSCDLNAAYIMLPLGVVHVKDKALWVVQWSGWTHEHYSVLDVKDDRIETETWARGGNCPDGR
jgi:hypothetical protein